MPHAWPGGTTDPKYKGYTDTKAPERRRGLVGVPQALPQVRHRAAVRGGPGRPRARDLPTRKVTVTLRRGARVHRVRARVGGRRVRTTIRGRRIRLKLPSGPKGKVRVRLRVRRQGRTPSQLVRRRFARC